MCINNENESEIRISLKPYTKVNIKEDKDLNVGRILCKFEDNMGGQAVTPVRRGQSHHTSVISSWATGFFCLPDKLPHVDRIFYCVLELFSKPSFTSINKSKVSKVESLKEELTEALLPPRCPIFPHQIKVKVLVAQSCGTLCDPMGYSPPGSSIHGFFQGRIL